MIIKIMRIIGRKLLLVLNNLVPAFAVKLIIWIILKLILWV